MILIENGMKQAPDIFIAYSHNDLRFKDELKKFLRPLLNTKRASLWDDHDIEAGKEWEAEIKKRLYGADIILLLVSPDSLASDYFYGREVTVSLERHEKGEAVVVPVILRPCAWTITPLAKLEALPAKGKPVTQWPSQDEAFTDIAHSIGEIVVVGLGSDFISPRRVPRCWFAGVGYSKPMRSKSSPRSMTWVSLNRRP